MLYYEKITPKYKLFVSYISQDIEPKTYNQTIKIFHWKEEMLAELKALEENQTWDSVTLSSNKKSIGGKWVYKKKKRLMGPLNSTKPN